jgi:hypothetical protein
MSPGTVGAQSQPIDDGYRAQAGFASEKQKVAAATSDKPASLQKRSAFIAFSDSGMVTVE